MLTADLPEEPTSPATERTFEAFVGSVEPVLRGCLVALYGAEDGRDATAEALGWAWEHWSSVSGMEHPVGYLLRVAQSRSRRHRQPVLRVVPEVAEHDFEPKLPAALRRLPERQRVVVVLVHGLGYSVRDVADLLAIEPTTVRNHLERGLRRLRRSLGVDRDDR